MDRSNILHISLVTILSALAGNNVQAGVYLGDLNEGGIAYHLTFQFENPGSFNAKTGDILPSLGNAADRQDFNNDGLVDELAVKAWRLNLTPGANAAPIGDYGWSRNARWSVIDLNGLANNGYTQAQVSITLKADSTAPQGNGEFLHDLIPGMTAWKGQELTTGASGVNNWFPNAATSNNWNDWWAADLKQSALNGDVWWAADDSNNPTHAITLHLPWMTLGGSNDFISLAFGGNNYSYPTLFNFANFKATVTVQAVPVPAAVWLFGSALAGLSVFRRRKTLVEV